MFITIEKEEEGVMFFVVSSSIVSGRSKGQKTGIIGFVSVESRAKAAEKLGLVIGKDENPNRGSTPELDFIFAGPLFFKKGAEERYVQRRNSANHGGDLIAYSLTKVLELTGPLK